MMGKAIFSLLSAQNAPASHIKPKQPRDDR